LAGHLDLRNRRDLRGDIDFGTSLHGDRHLNYSFEIEQANETLADFKEELATTNAEAEKLRESMKVKGDNISWLRAYMAQLTQTIYQLALPPSKEEAKAKS
jgi:hypothetical protein